MTQIGEDLNNALCNRVNNTLEELYDSDINEAAKEVFLKWSGKLMDYITDQHSTKMEPFRSILVKQYNESYQKWLINNGIIFGSGLEESRENTSLQATKTVENLVVSNGITSTE
jgi:hypothetical protein